MTNYGGWGANQVNFAVPDIFFVLFSDIRNNSLNASTSLCTLLWVKQMKKMKAFHVPNHINLSTSKPVTLECCLRAIRGVFAGVLPANKVKGLCSWGGRETKKLSCSDWLKYTQKHALNTLNDKIS